jgi:hypothetical protein
MKFLSRCVVQQTRYDYGGGVSNRAPLGVRQDMTVAERREVLSERSERVNECSVAEREGSSERSGREGQEKRLELGVASRSKSMSE